MCTYMYYACNVYESRIYSILVIDFVGIGVLENIWDSLKCEEASAVAHGKNKEAEAYKNAKGDGITCICF